MVNFRDCFRQLTEKDPFDWQERLFEKFLEKDLPDACDIPTGLGKTFVMAIWLIALGSSLKDKERKIPLRLVYVVDRRVIVDQATSEAESLFNKLRQAVSEPLSPLHSLARTFLEASMRGRESPITLSTLRGQRADRREWCLDPSRPAIIVGTVDMIGSRLLFSGYGRVGINHRSLQAGLLGQDTLVVVDEAHLSPVFVRMLLDTKSAVHRTPLLRPFHVMTLSATLGGKGSPFSLDVEKECRNEEARRRLNAKKQIEWLEFDQLAAAKDPKKGASLKEINEAFAECLVNGALRFESEAEGEPAKSVVIFVQTVDLVNLVADKLGGKLEEIAARRELAEPADKKGRAKLREAIEDRILKLTGEMRGAERNDLVLGAEDNELVETGRNSLKLKEFLPERDRQTPRSPFYLIATSAAEVGVNLDADHGLCDLSTLDSMIQRIGRINRFGKTEATVTVVIDERGLEAAALDIRNEEMHRQSLSKLSVEINELENQLSRGQFDKAAKKEIQKQLSARKGERRTLEKGGAKTGPKNIEKAKPKIYFTWEALKAKADENGKVNASPLALRGLLNANRRALPDAPDSPPFDDARLDDWAMTSLKQKDYPRPLVQYWLRGVIDDETAQTALVWRADLDHFHFNFSGLTPEEIRKQLKPAEELATAIPIQPQERANVATHRAERLLKELAKKFPDKPFVIIDPAGDEEGYSGEELRDDKGLFKKLAFSTIILPCAVGGLDKDGNPLEKVKDIKPRQMDVVSKEWTRYLITRHSSEKFSRKQLGVEESEESFYTSLRDALKTNKGVRVNTKELQQVFAGEEESASYVAIYCDRNSTDHFLREDVDDVASLDLPKKRTVDEHDTDVERYVRLLAERIGLPNELIEALAEAGFRHDRGKNRPWWQRAIGNFSDTPYAKSDSNSFDHNLNQYYRHEFGSLVESLDDESLSAHPHRDLILHLIAAHHGYARPHFPERAFDRNQPKPLNRQIAHETMLRFDRLQRQYGWWQLAYLEAVLKAADAMASRDFSEGKLL